MGTASLYREKKNTFTKVTNCITEHTYTQQILGKNLNWSRRGAMTAFLFEIYFTLTFEGKDNLEDKSRSQRHPAPGILG